VLCWNSGVHIFVVFVRNRWMGRRATGEVTAIMWFCCEQRIFRADQQIHEIDTRVRANPTLHYAHNAGGTQCLQRKQMILELTCWGQRRKVERAKGVTPPALVGHPPVGTWVHDSHDRCIGTPHYAELCVNLHEIQVVTEHVCG
jgi:hypothetical protein